MTLSRTLIRNLELIIRILLCGIGTLLNVLYIGFQGNGNPIPSGLFLGLLMGLGWSIPLLFGIPKSVRNISPSAKTALSFGSLLSAVIIIIILFRLTCK